jgi:hypothetical protein
MIEWAKRNDEEAQRIAANAQRFAIRNLNRQARLCYIFRLLTELSKQMKCVGHGAKEHEITRQQPATRSLVWGHRPGTCENGL